MFFANIVSPATQQSLIGGHSVMIPSSALLYFIKGALRAVPVNERWYLKRYPDVSLAVQNGKIASAKEHFVEHGYIEGRLPYRIKVDEEFYLRKNCDVADIVAKQVCRNGQDHFETFGYLEGRAPFEGFSFFEPPRLKQISRFLGGRGMLFSRMRNQHAADNKPASSNSIVPHSEPQK